MGIARNGSASDHLQCVQERFHKRSPGDFESTFIKAGVSETKEELKIEEITGESSALLWLFRNVIGKK